MSASHPKVTLGLPVYNGGAFLEESLQALLKQTFADFEIIISDNASTDRTQEICRNFAEKDTRIQYVRNTHNLGAAANYNQTFRLAKGTYFKWAAHDDICYPGFLDACVDVLDKNPNVVICYSRTRLIDASGDVLEDYSDNLNLRQVKPTERFIRLLETPGWCNPIFGLMRTEVLARTPLIGSYPRSDRNLLAELSLNGEFYELPDYLFGRRVHAEISTEVYNTEDDLAAWFDTRHQGKSVYPRWRRYSNYAEMVWRSPLRWSERILLYRYLGRFVFSVGKISALVGDIHRGLTTKRAVRGA